MRDYQLYVRNENDPESVPRRTWERMAVRRNSHVYKDSVFFSPQRFKKGVRRIVNFDLFRTWCIDLDKKDFKSNTKEEIQERIKKSPVEPTFIIDTKNGYHVYWFCKQNIMVADAKMAANSYKQFMNQCVIPFFNADKQSAMINMTLRAPYHYHWKDPKNPYLVLPVDNNFKPFKEYIHFNNQLINKEDCDKYRLYTWDDMRKAFPVISRPSHNESRWINQSLRMSSHDILFCVPIVDLAEKFGIKFHSKNYNNVVKCYCPFHDEKTPSFYIYNQKGGEPKNDFYCYGCQRGGNVINFTALALNCTNGQAVSYLKENYVRRNENE